MKQYSEITKLVKNIKIAFHKNYPNEDIKYYYSWISSSKKLSLAEMAHLAILSNSYLMPSLKELNQINNDFAYQLKQLILQSANQFNNAPENITFEEFLNNEELFSDFDRYQYSCMNDLKREMLAILQRDYGIITDSNIDLYKLQSTAFLQSPTALFNHHSMVIPKYTESLLSVDIQKAKDFANNQYFIEKYKGIIQCINQNCLLPDGMFNPRKAISAGRYKSIPKSLDYFKELGKVCPYFKAEIYYGIEDKYMSLKLFDKKSRINKIKESELQNKEQKHMPEIINFMFYSDKMKELTDFYFAMRMKSDNELMNLCKEQKLQFEENDNRFYLVDLLIVEKMKTLLNKQDIENVNDIYHYYVNSYLAFCEFVNQLAVKALKSDKIVNNFKSGKYSYTETLRYFNANTVNR